MVGISNVFEIEFHQLAVGTYDHVVIPVLVLEMVLDSQDLVGTKVEQVMLISRPLALGEVLLERTLLQSQLTLALQNEENTLVP